MKVGKIKMIFVQFFVISTDSFVTYEMMYKQHVNIYIAQRMSYVHMD